MQRNYKKHLSGYINWDQLEHAEDWILFAENIGSHICIDEVALTQGELYTVVTNASFPSHRERYSGFRSFISYFYQQIYGAKRAALIYTLVANAKLQGLEPFAYMRDIISRIADYPYKTLVTFYL